MGLLSSFLLRPASSEGGGEADAPDDLARARTRARQRLIGAVVLVGIGVIAFPLLFETQPRPIPVDVAIDLPKRAASSPNPAPARAPQDIITETAAEAGLKPARGAPAGEAAAPASAAAPRFIVQIGAFADPALAQQTRLKVERLGLTTYTHVAQTPDGARTRVRVGPVTTRQEAEKMAARIKAAGMPAAILTL
ncbi:SPOR domain-containing protein [Piscinibacter sakaiensis]|uniref:SPOR domain-containing protein n=1 Tax=Piscinibacter sakaiensis TaxID=1547922 RepID=UPI00372C12B2